MNKNRSRFLVISVIVFGLLYSTSFMNTVEENISQALDVSKSYEAQIIEPTSKGLYQSQAVISIKGIAPNAILYTSLDVDLDYLDTISFTGKFSEIDNSDSYGQYLNSKNIYLEVKNSEITSTSKSNSIVSKANKIKILLESTVRRILPDTEAAFLNGLLFGTKSDLPEELKEDFQRTGTSHIVAASGFNVVIVYLCIKFILQKFFKFKQVIIISVVFVWIYSFMLGSYNIPALRATLMLTIYLLAKLAGNRSYILVSLITTNLILLLINPQVINNISFQLSSLAVLGLVLFSNNIKNLLLNIMPDNFITEGVATTIAATILTIPITFNAFQSTSILAVIVNVIVLPLIPLIMGVGVLSILAINIPILSSVLTVVLSSTINFITETLGFFSQLTFISTSNLLVTLIYGCILVSLLILSDYVEFKEKFFKKSK